MSKDREVRIKRGGDGLWCWSRVAKRGNLPDAIVADGGEGYASESGALEAAARENPGLPIVVVEDDGAG